MYLDSFWISAYQLTWNGGYMLVSLRISQDEDCVVKCGLCSVCVTSLANPLYSPVVRTNTELCLCHDKLGCTYYICLATHPPTCLLSKFFQRTNSRSKCTWEQLALKIWTYHRTHQTVFIFTLSVVISFVLFLVFLGLYGTCKNLWTVFKIDICILDYFKNDRLHIFSLIFILREKNKCIIYF